MEKINHLKSKFPYFALLLSLLGFVSTCMFLIGFVIALQSTGKIFNYFQGAYVNQDALSYTFLHFQKHDNFFISYNIYFWMFSMGVLVFLLLRTAIYSLKNTMKIYLILHSILLLTWFDLYSKMWIFQHFGDGRARPMIGKILYFTYRENTGMAWSLLEGHTGFLSIMSMVAIVLVIYFFWMTRKSLVMNLALILILSGALGNLYDRVWYRYVRDFIDFRFFPVFNIADSCICVGAFLIILYTFLEEARERKVEKNKDLPQKEDCKSQVEEV